MASCAHPPVISRLCLLSANQSRDSASMASGGRDSKINTPNRVEYSVSAVYLTVAKLCSKKQVQLMEVET